jgi:ribosomal-protein-alanine N-acetyltransferase
MPESIELNTAHLTGRPITSADFPSLRQIHSDPRAAKTLSADGRPLAEARTRVLLDASVAHWTAHGFGVWIFHNLEGDFAGYAGTRHAIVEGTAEVELLYAIHPRFWNRGYATEMAEAVLRFTFDQVRLNQIVAFTLPINVGSRRVMEKCGFRHQRDIVHAGLPHVLYTLSEQDLAVA